MQPTRYSPQTDDSGSPTCASGVVTSGQGLALFGRQGPNARRSTDRGGRKAPLDLIEEHLTDGIQGNEYRQGFHGGRLLDGWFVPEDFKGVSEQNPERFVLKIQPFAKGGYEASVRLLNLEKIGRAIDFGGKKGKREAPEEISIGNQQKAAARSKRKMRHLVKNMMADHLVTFTKREREGSDYWTPEQWAKVWDAFRRLLVRVIGEFPYVAILEQHEKGNYHLHVAWCGRVNVGLVRKMWLAAIGGGKGCGNIDAKRMKVRQGCDRAAKIAQYISKYVSKGFDQDQRFNKKRYWASRQTLETVRRYVLGADTLDGAQDAALRMLGVDLGKFRTVDRFGNDRLENFFPFPDGSGFWWAYIPELHDTGPPPF